MIELTELIEALKKKVHLTQVLDHFDIEYEESEARFRIICPFHDDHVPSLIVYTDNEDGYDTFWCPPCPRTGDSFEFIRLMTRLKLGLSLDDKSDFSESLEVLKRLANYIETKTDIKQKVLDRLTTKEEKADKNAHKKYYYMCGVEIRDALKERLISEKEADEVFRKIDKRLDNKDVKEAEKFHNKVKEILKRRRHVQV